MPTFTNIHKDDLTVLQNFGFYFEPVKSEYEIARMKGSCVLVLFNSNKLLIQGKEKVVNDLVEYLRKNHIGKYVHPINFVNEKGIVIGTDEALKGDTFGGIVVAGVKADEDMRERLKLVGVEDSKKLKDFEIHVIAQKIKKIVPYHIVNLSPNQYNLIVEELGNVTNLLNRMHQRCIDELDFHDLAVVDKYPGCKVKAKMLIKAESKYVEVAAASILARSEALKQLKKLSKELKMPVPKGSTHVKEALQTLKQNKKHLKKYVKLHFKNVQKYA